MKWYTNSEKEKKLKEIIKKKFNFDLKEKIIFRDEQAFLVSKEIEEFYKKILRKPYSLGMYLGTFKKEFKPSLQFIFLLSKKIKNKIRVSEKNAIKFSYGNNIFVKQEITGEIIILNKNKLLIGYGKAGKEKRGTKIKNIQDVGWYLRKGG